MTDKKETESPVEEEVKKHISPEKEKLQEEAEELIDRAEDAEEWANAAHSQLTDVRETATEMYLGIEAEADLLKRLGALTQEEYDEVIESVRKAKTVRQRFSIR